jgi:phosphatidylinositol-3-phosphatase
MHHRGMKEYPINLYRSIGGAGAGAAPVLLLILLVWFQGIALATAGQLPPVQTVFVILMENQAWSEIRSGGDAPYLTGTLLPMASSCEAYYNVPGMHPSLPNYLWLEAGTNFGIFDDSDPALHHQNTTNHLVTLLDQAGVTWRSYPEDISGTCVPLIRTNAYVPRHNPVVYFDDVTGTNDPTYAYGIAHIRPYAELASDLANNSVAAYNFISPNVCHDMHDPCPPLTNQIKQGDTWLANEVPKILNSQAFRNNGALFITWDESYDVDTRIGTLLLSPLARGGGYTNYVYYTHSSMLRTLQEIFHVGPFLGDAANANDLSDLFEQPPVPATGFRISKVAPLGNNALELTVSGVATNAPLILQSSSPLLQWTSILTNLAPSATSVISLTNDTTNPGHVFYRFLQPLP